ncbi:MAG: hydroxyacid dehydrogenase [Armatimonadetes bacterium]|nr:hydroxyacid dehydrogenase [Armatimonadota bacterium]
MGTHRIAVTATEDFPVEMAVVHHVLGELGEISVVPMPFRPLAPDEVEHFTHEFREVDAVLLRPGIFSRPLLEAARRLRIIAVHGAGVDQVDVVAATECGIVVTNAPGANANAVAELTLGLILSLLRGIPEADRRVRLQGQWGEARIVGRELRGRTVGLLGLGAVGRRVAALARAFGARTITYDPYIDQAAAGPDVQLVDLETVLRESDVISLHMPLTPETQGMVSAASFPQMKPGVVLVNAARGGVIDEAALLEALERGHVAGAALDVLAEEPPVSRPALFDHPRVIVTPHMGGSTVESLDHVARVAAEEIARCLRGETLRHVVNPQVRPRR